MITKFICDSCGMEVEGHPHGYPEEGDNCIVCHKKSELYSAKRKADEKENRYKDAKEEFLVAIAAVEALEKEIAELKKAQEVSVPV